MTRMVAPFLVLALTSACSNAGQTQMGLGVGVGTNGRTVASSVQTTRGNVTIGAAGSRTSGSGTSRGMGIGVSG
jgi:hypothetical protein